MRNTNNLLVLDQLINGEMVRGEGGNKVVINPATEGCIAELPLASIEQAEKAVAAARRAFVSGVWRDPEFRVSVLTRLADLLTEHEEELADLLITETGCPTAVSSFLQVRGPIDMLRDVIARAGDVPDRDLGVHKGPPASRSLIKSHPVGVVVGIGAYNNPLLYLVSKACAAMAVGCTVVHIPSLLAPLTTLRFAALAQEAGVPAGVLNILAGDRDVARFLSSHPDVDKVTLTGSVEVGRAVMAQASETVKGLVLELGGKSAGIVLPGADLQASSMALHGRYLRNSGQGCQSPTRLLVPRAVYDDFIDIARTCFAKIPVGDPRDPATLAGPLISESHRQKVERHVADALASGGEILVGGGRPDIEKGWFMNGALIGGLGNDSRLAQTELFGPVAMVMAYDDVDEAVRIANDSPFGLAASVFGPTDLALEVAPRLQAGTVAINGGGGFRVDSVLTGWKQSGLGREWGSDGLEEFRNVQHIQWIDA